MAIKNLILSLVAVLAASAYAFLVGAFPEFPLPQEKFVALILWAVGLLFAGWQIEKQVLLNRSTLKGFRGEPMPFEWKPILKALLLVVLPVVYSLIVGWNESFPIAQDEFIAILLFLIGLPIGGWQLAVSVYKGQRRLE
jgi:hypothetical protein